MLINQYLIHLVSSLYYEDNGNARGYAVQKTWSERYGFGSVSHAEVLKVNLGVGEAF